MNGTAWITVAVLGAILGVLQLLVVGGIFGLFKKLLDTERRLSTCEGVLLEREKRLLRVEGEINDIHKTD